MDLYTHGERMEGGAGETIACAGALQTPSSIHIVVSLLAVETRDRCYDYSVSSGK